MTKLKSWALATVVALGSAGFLIVPTTSAMQSENPDPKVFVCKYVGTPGVDERLKDGKNPISVSSNATVGTYFNDAQGRSYVLSIDDTEPGPQDDPDVSECPGGEMGSPDTSVSAVCDTINQIVRVTFNNEGNAQSEVSVNGTSSTVAAGATVNVTTPITGATVAVNVTIDGESEVLTVSCPTGGSGTVTPSGNTPTSNNTTTAAATTVPVAVRGGGSGAVASLPVTSGGNDGAAAITLIASSLIAAAGTYVSRMRGMVQF